MFGQRSSSCSAAREQFDHGGDCGRILDTLDRPFTSNYKTPPALLGGEHDDPCPLEVCVDVGRVLACFQQVPMEYIVEGTPQRSASSIDKRHLTCRESEVYVSRAFERCCSGASLCEPPSNLLLTPSSFVHKLPVENSVSLQLMVSSSAA